MTKSTAMPDVKETLPEPSGLLLHQPPARGVRIVSLTLCAFAILAIGYASLVSMDVVITGTGRVVPSGKTVLVQTASPGVVSRLFVHDGQPVKAGDALLELRAVKGPAPAAAVAEAGLPSGTQAYLDARLLESLSKLAALEAEVTRHQAERDAVVSTLTELQKSVDLVGKKYQMREELSRSGHVAQSTLIDSKLELINLQKELYAQQNRLQETEAALSAAIQARTQAEAEFKARYPQALVEIANHPVESETRKGIQEIRASVDGVVHWLTSLAAGQSIGSTQNIMVIVPESAPLEVEALVANRDIGHLKIGQRAVVKIETYDYTRYGHIEGMVIWVGQDAINDQKLGPVYSTRIALKSFETPNTVNGERGKLAPGMNVTADILVTERRMISYFLAPLLRYKEESLRER